MERAWCCLVGFAIALVLVAGFLIARSVVEECREKMERTAKHIAETVFYVEFQKMIGYYPCSLGDFVDKRIDLKLAEKEGEHEGD